MNAPEAREQLDLVDRVLAHAERTIHPSGTLFVLWGVVAAVLDLTFQAIYWFRGAFTWWWFAPAVVLYAVALTTTIAYVNRARRCDRLSIIEAQYLRVLFISLCAAGLAVFCGNIFNGWADGAIWSIAYAIPLTFIGVQGNRIALAGGIVLFASILVANFIPNAPGIVLAIGMLVGYAGAGIAIEAERARANG
ncbi:MAG: hypothetical protein JO177_01055 [Candidatus Eremiobacteraeota bacterium]|nr:hypothetical protein [Candidatus Eremiobacteraeota bacterium]